MQNYDSCLKTDKDASFIESEFMYTVMNITKRIESLDSRARKSHRPLLLQLELEVNSFLYPFDLHNFLENISHYKIIVNLSNQLNGVVKQPPILLN